MKNMKDKLVNVARQLRKNQTDYEAKLWSRLRGRRFGDFKFVRQYPVGNYIVDFCFRQEKLIIELDGGQHNEDKQIKSDKVRDEYLEKKGYRMLRIWNNELAENLEGVLDEIYYRLTNNPHPLNYTKNPLPKGEGK
jgi:type I restriction enzyme M protein